ncbi:MAG: response regulator [Candidatus Tectimicrobiota bacterium]
MQTPSLHDAAYAGLAPDATGDLLSARPRHTVLFVDDEPHVLDGLRRGLRKAPYVVLCASTVEQAFVYLRARHVDVVVADHDMPGMTGTVFLAKVRQEFPATARCILTGKPTLDIALQAINTGAISRFFLKPCHPYELQLSLRDIVQQHDLLLAAQRLLEAVREQSPEHAQLERHYPGITRVQRDTDGTIVASPDELSVEDLIAQLRQEAEQVSRRRGQADSAGAAAAEQTWHRAGRAQP